MSKDLNKVMLTGRLGADPEMRYTNTGTPVTTFRVASNRTWQSTDGQKHEDTEWFSVVAWNKLAEICNQYLIKGSRVYVEGRLQTRSWDDAETGEKRYKTEVVAENMIMLDSRRDGAGDDDAEADTGPSEPAPQPQPRGGQRPPARAQSRQPGNGARRPVMEEEDIPF